MHGLSGIQINEVLLTPVVCTSLYRILTSTTDTLQTLPDVYSKISKVKLFIKFNGLQRTKETPVALNLARGAHDKKER